MKKTVERISYGAAGVGGELAFLGVECPSSGGESGLRFGDHLVHARTGNVRVFVGDHTSESEVLFNEVVRHNVFEPWKGWSASWYSGSAIPRRRITVDDFAAGSFG